MAPAFAYRGTAAIKEEASVLCWDQINARHVYTAPVMPKEAKRLEDIGALSMYGCAPISHQSLREEWSQHVSHCVDE